MNTNTKPIHTDDLDNLCKCGKYVRLKRCIWLEESESKLKIFTPTGLLKGKPTLTDKHKSRTFYLGVCDCGKIFYYKPSRKR